MTNSTVFRIAMSAGFAAASFLTGVALTAQAHTAPHTQHRTPPASAPVIATCVETVDWRGDASLNHCHTTGSNTPAMLCARAAFLADDYAHTHTGARAERRAIRRCAAQVDGF